MPTEMVDTIFDEITSGINIEHDRFLVGWMYFQQPCQLKGFATFMDAKLAQLNLLIIFWPNLAYIAIDKLMHIEHKLLCPELHLMLPILLEEVQGNFPGRVQIKTNIIKPQLIFHATSSTIENADVFFAAANKAANRFLADSAVTKTISVQNYKRLRMTQG